jgi:hypothetical protein
VHTDPDPVADQCCKFRENGRVTKLRSVLTVAWILDPKEVLPHGILARLTLARQLTLRNTGRLVQDRSEMN